MDLASALSLLGQLTGIAKGLREIDKGFDAATYKAQIAELYSGIADLKIAFSDAKDQLREKDDKIRELEAELKAIKEGNPCPLCGSPLKTTKVTPHRTMGVAGIQSLHLECSKCDHKEERLHDPNGRIDGNRRRR